MDEAVFADKSTEPTERELGAVLGKAKRLWDELVAQAMAASPEAQAGWKHYAGKSGWVWVLRGRERNLIYLKPGEQSFLASFAFGDAAVEAAKTAGLPEALVKQIVDAPKYPEGRPVRVEVRSASDAKIARRLLEIKVASGGGKTERRRSRKR